MSDKMVIDGKEYDNKFIPVSLSTEEYAHLKSTFNKMLDNSEFDELEYVTMGFLLKTIKIGLNERGVGLD